MGHQTTDYSPDTHIACEAGLNKMQDLAGKGDLGEYLGGGAYTHAYQDAHDDTTVILLTTEIFKLEILTHLLGGTRVVELDSPMSGFQAIRCVKLDFPKMPEWDAMTWVISYTVPEEGTCDDILLALEDMLYGADAYSAGTLQLIRATCVLITEAKEVVGIDTLIKFDLHSGQFCEDVDGKLYCLDAFVVS